MSFLNKKAVKELCQKKGRRAGKDFIDRLDYTVERMVEEACKIHNGGKVTLDNEVASYAGLKVNCRIED